MKYNQKKKKENVEIFLFIMVMAVFAAVLGVMSLGEKMQPVNQIRKISSGWYYYDNGKRTEVTLPDTIQAEKGEELILYNDGITDLDAGKVVTTRGAQYDLKIWLGDRPIYEYQDTTFVRNTQMKSKLECVGEIPTDMQNEPLKLVYSNPHHGKYVLTSVYIGTGSAVIALHLQNSGIVIGIALCFLVRRMHSSKRTRMTATHPAWAQKSIHSPSRLTLRALCRPRVRCQLLWYNPQLSRQTGTYM